MSKSSFADLLYGGSAYDSGYNLQIKSRNPYDALHFRTFYDWDGTSTLTLEDDTMKPPRIYFEFLIVRQDDSFDITGVIAESERDARDEIVCSLPTGTKVKDVEIVLKSQTALKPKTEVEIVRRSSKDA